MLKNSKLLGIILSIVMVLAFNIGGFAYYEYTQESGTNFFVSAADKADALEDTNEMRQIIDDLGDLLGHSKRDDSYPKDGTTGGDIDINRITAKTGVATLTTGEAGFVKVSAAAGYSLTLPTAVGNKLTYIFVKTDDNTNLITIDGHASQTINGSLTYTDLNYQYAYVAIRSDNANWFVLFRSRPIGIADNNLLEVDGTPNDDEYTRFTANGLEGRTEAEFKGDFNLEIGTDVLAEQTIGIADNNLLEVDDASAADDEYAKFTANGLEGRTYAEAKTELDIGTNIVLCSNYDNPDDAITAISSDNTTLLVTEAETCDTNFTVPANVCVKFERGGKWTIENGITVTFNGSIDAGLWQIFSCTGTGTVVLNSGSTAGAYAEWWGAVGDGSTDNAAIFNSVLSQLNGSEIRTMLLGGFSYVVTDTITLYEGIAIIGQNKYPMATTTADVPEQTKILFAPTSEKSLFDITVLAGDSYVRSVYIGGISITGNTTGGVTHSLYAIDNAAAYSVFENLGIARFQDGIYLEKTMANVYRDIYMREMSHSCIYTSIELNTTDIFINVALRESPWGAIIRRGGGLRFSDCLFESLTTGGVNLYKESGQVDFIGCYGEAVPSSADGNNYAMFYINFDGATLEEGNVSILGGNYSGVEPRHGTFLYVDETATNNQVSVMGSHIKVNVNGIKATVNTVGNTINLTGHSFNDITNEYVDTTGKLNVLGTAISIEDGLIVEADLNADEDPVDNDICTFDETGANFSWQTPAELSIAQSSNKLSYFSATTSAELAGVLSDETGSGKVVLGTMPTFTTKATISGATNSSLYIDATADNATLYLRSNLDNVGGEESAIKFYNYTALQWSLYKSSTADFILYNYIDSKYAFVVEDGASIYINPADTFFGINTSSPSGNLDINVVTDADPHILLSENDVTMWDFYNKHETDAMQILSGTTLVAEIDTSGNIDIKSGAMYKVGGIGEGLLSTTTVAFNADADTTLYTVPTGKRCVLSHAIVVAAGDAGATTTISIGQNTAETDFIPANTLSNLDAQYDSVILQPIPNTTPLKIKSYAAATVIEAQIATQSGVAGNTIYLFGILY